MRDSCRTRIGLREVVERFGNSFTSFVFVFLCTVALFALPSYDSYLSQTADGDTTWLFSFNKYFIFICTVLSTPLSLGKKGTSRIKGNNSKNEPWTHFPPYLVSHHLEFLSRNYLALSILGNDTILKKMMTSLFVSSRSICFMPSTGNKKQKNKIHRLKSSSQLFSII